MSTELGKITFQKYVSALFANKDFETTPGKFHLPTVILPNVMSHIVDKSTYRELTSDANLENVSGANITFKKLVSSSFKRKTTIGTGDLKPFTIPSITLQFDAPVQGGGILSAADLALGLPNIAAKKLEKFLADFIVEFDIDAFREIATYLGKTENASQKSGLNFLTTTPQQIYEAIVSLATKLTLMKDYKEGINLILRDAIRIFVEPTVFDKLAMVGLVGNRVMETMSSGQYGIGLLAGYKIISSPSLASTNLKVLVGTNFSCGAAFKLIAANIGKHGNSNDLEVYFEAVKLNGIVYPTTLRGIVQDNTATEITGEATG